VFVGACNGPNGAGRVQAHFFKNECGPGDPKDLANYSFDAGWLATERYGAMLVIQIQQYKAELEESDGLSIRLDLKRMMTLGIFATDPRTSQIVRADPTRAAVVATSTLAGDVNVALSLFTTCPNFPTSFARAGVLSLDKVTIAADPTNSGENERLGGTVTATLSRANEDGPVGTLQAVFDFSPPRRPLINNM
jgi:hypothetical protein